MITILVDDGPDKDGIYYVRVRDHLMTGELLLRVPEERTFGELLRRAREAHQNGEHL